MFEIHKRRGNKHHGLKQEKANVPFRVIFCNASQELLQVQDRHETVHPLNIAS